jgi:hypothetical protein
MVDFADHMCTAGYQYIVKDKFRCHGGSHAELNLNLLTKLESNMSGILVRHKSTAFFLSALPQTDGFAKALTTASLERGIEPGSSRSSAGAGQRPGDVDAMVSVRQVVIVVVSSGAV